VTFSCIGREPLFIREEIREHLTRLLGTFVRAGDLELHAFVFMPEHVHLMATDGKLRVMRSVSSFKRRFALDIRRHYPHLFPAHRREGAVWLQGGGYIRHIWSGHEYGEKWNYIHANPVRRGLVKHARDWIGCSAVGSQALGFPLAPPPADLADLVI